MAPYRSASQSSIKKFSSSTGFLASLPLSTGPTPSSPIYNVNPTLSLPVTPVKYTSDMNDTKLTNGTSGYLSDSPPSDKGIVESFYKVNIAVFFCNGIVSNTTAKYTM